MPLSFAASFLEPANPSPPSIVLRVIADFRAAVLITLTTETRLWTHLPASTRRIAGQASVPSIRPEQLLAEQVT